MRPSIALLLLLVLASCSDPAPPPPKPAEPQAGKARHTELRDAIQAPQDRARAVEGDTLDAAEAQRQRIEAQGG